jgi:hypothetical protein
MAKSNAKSQAKSAAQVSKPRKAAAATKTVRNGKPKSAKLGAAADEASDLKDWRGETLARMRELILQADAEITEEVKWKKPSNPAGVPVWSRAGIICTGEIYKQVVKLTFARGASIKDPKRLFNSSLDGNARRAIDIREGEMPDAKAFTALIKAAVAENLRLNVPKAKSQSQPTATTKASASSKTLPKIKASQPNPLCRYSPAATLRSPRPTATHRCKPTSQRCPAGSASWASGSTSSSSAPCPTCAKQ